MEYVNQHIEQRFQEIESILSKNITYDKIKNSLSELRSEIDELETSNELSYYYYNNKLFTLWVFYLDFFKQPQEEIESFQKKADINKKKFDRKLADIQQAEQESAYKKAQGNTSSNPVENPNNPQLIDGKNNFCDDPEALLEIKDSLKQAGLEDKTIEGFIKLCGICFKPFGTLLDYFEAKRAESTLECSLQPYFASYGDEINSSKEVNKSSEEKNDVFLTLQALKATIKNKIELNLKNILKKILVDEAALRLQLFAGIELTQENIKRRYEQFRTIHPDKFSEECKKEASDFFSILSSERDKKLAELQSAEHKNGEEKLHRECAIRLWQMAVAYQETLKPEHKRDKSKINILETRDYTWLSDDEKRLRKQLYAQAAFEHYRSICQIYDREISQTLQQNNNTIPEAMRKRQVTIRRELSLTLIMAELYFEAQVYVIGAIHILLQCESISQQELEDLNALFKKIKEKTTYSVSGASNSNEESPERLPNNIQPINSEADARAITNSNDRALVLSSGSINSPAGRKSLYTQLSKHYDEIVLRYLSSPDKSLVNYSSPYEAILHARRLSFLHRTTAFTVGALGFSVGSIGFLTGAIKLAAFVATGTVFGGPVGGILGLLGGIITIGGGLFASMKLINKAKEIGEEPEIREKLNTIIAEAMQFYQRDNFIEFLRTLNRAYHNNNRRLIDEINGKFSFNPEEKIEILLKHGFRPDGIAYLLITIGDVLASGKVTFEKMPRSDVLVKAKEIFRAVFTNEYLIKESEKLDKAIANARFTPETEPTMLDKIMKKIRQAFAITRHDIPQSYFSDAEHAPFMARLNEIQMAAKLNYTIVEIVSGGADNLVLARDTIIEIREAVSHKYQYFSVASSRLSTIEDLLCAFGFDPSIPEKHNDIIPLRITQADYLEPSFTDEEGAALELKQYKFENGEIDTLNLLCYLTDGKFSKSRTEFIELLLAARNNQNNQLLAEEIWNTFKDKEFFNNKLFKKAYIPLLAVLTNIQFKLCFFDSNTNKIMPFPAEADSMRTVNISHPIKTLYLLFSGIHAELPETLCVNNNDSTLKCLSKQLRRASNAISQSEVLVLRGNHQLAQAKEIHPFSHIRSILLAQEAQQDFIQALEKNPLQLNAIFGITEVYLLLGQSHKAMSLLLEREKSFSELRLKENAFWWFLLAKSYRKMQKYKDAKHAIVNALSHLTSSSTMKKAFEAEKKVIAGLELQSLNVSEVKYSYKLEADPNIYLNRHANRDYYNILSIDGGGIRGIVPAMILSEIEKRSNKPIAHSFNMLAGTSTGGIISLGLAYPKEENNSFAPKYTASELLTMYTTQGPTIFTSPGFFTWYTTGLFGATASKYTAEGRQKLFRQYFSDTKMDALLTDVVVPAVDCYKNFYTHRFSRTAAKKGSMNVPIWHVAMATSAAPTFFPAHQVVTHYESRIVSIPPHGGVTEIKVPMGPTCVDGGVQANNPSDMAYQAALQNGVAPTNIFLLSLGTGSCVTSSMSSISNDGKLFWAANLHHLIGAQQNNTDDQLHTQLGKNYKRFQFWMDKPKPMDDIRKESIDYLVNAGQEMIEEMDASEDNTLNKVIERLNL